MQSPIIVFDHITKTVTMLPTGPMSDKRLADVLAAQRDQVATSGRPAS
jgi:hypothetical protein